VADHIIDMGPEGGKHGGTLVASGTPEELLKYPESHTARFLQPYLTGKHRESHLSPTPVNLR